MSVENLITALAAEYSERLKTAITGRVAEMVADDVSHHLIYKVLGVAEEEGRLIDIYQNKGRFLYKYAGSFLEHATKLCFKEVFPGSASCRIPNTRGTRPRTFEIDCLVGNDALEIKWKDATTDGDHITKEHTRIQVISAAGYTPVRVMFYYPNRAQAIRIQEALAALYGSLGGHYFYGETAWQYVLDKTSINLKAILEEIARQRQGTVHAI